MAGLLLSACHTCSAVCGIKFVSLLADFFYLFVQCCKSWLSGNNSSGTYSELIFSVDDDIHPLLLCALDSRETEAKHCHAINSAHLSPFGPLRSTRSLEPLEIHDIVSSLSGHYGLFWHLPICLVSATTSLRVCLHRGWTSTPVHRSETEPESNN